MAWAAIALHGDLNDFLPLRRRGAGMHRHFDGHPAVKDLLEALGVPHPEIAAITVNGGSVGFDHRLRDGDQVEAWPAAEAAGSGLTTVLPAASEDTADRRFVVDGHLGRLAAYLRMLGFDTWYRNDADDDRLAAVADTEQRILLTRDRGLLKRSVVRRGAYLRSDRPIEQLIEVARRFGLADRWHPFGRCLACNTLLVHVSREEVLHRLQPLTRIYYDDFRRCPGCGAIYWKGSHHARMERLIDRVRTSIPRSTER
ncbi:MAG TPA: Mut7-C RNAse domain-containing protein [Candidatus Limnocylindrales bacterium]